MENVSKRISYLKGLMDGLGVEADTKESRIFNAILEVLDEINDTIDDLYDYQDELAQQVDLIDDDLAEVEEELIGCYEDDDDFDDDDEDSEYYELECPSCGDIICIDEDCFEGDDEIICPNCNKPIEIDFNAEDAE